MRSCYKIHIFGFMSQHLCVSGSFARSMSLDSCLSIVISQDPLHVSASTNLDPLQDPRLWAHVSASLYLRLLCKIHVSGSIYKHPYVSQDPLQDPCPRIHVLAFMSQHPFISQDPLQDPCLRSLSIFVSHDSLQDPCLRIHVSASTLIWILYKIHVFGLMSQHLCISGSSARAMAPDPYVSASICISGSSARSISPEPYIRPCLRIHVSASSNLRILCKIHVSDSWLSIHDSASLYFRNLCKIHVSGSVYISGSSARSMSPIHVSASLYLRVRCKIHVSDSCLSIHVSASIYISGSSARSMSPESQNLRISGFCTRSMSSDSCLSIH